MKRSLLAFTLLFSLNGNTAITPSELRHAGYFEKLDFFESKIAKEIPGWEVEQVTLAEEMVKNNDINPLSLAYIALYMVNTNEAIAHKRISIEDVMAKKSYSNGKVETELLERQKIIIKYLEIAHNLAPKDYRIETWLVGEYIRRGDEGAMDRLIEMGAQGQTFATAAAALVSREVHLTKAQDKKLLKGILKLNASCMFKEPSECIPLHYAPYTMPASFSIMSDFIYRYGITYNIKNLFPRIMPKALMLIQETERFKETSEAWRFKSDLADRKKIYSKAIKKKADYNMEFHRSEKASRAYQCAACHSSSQDPAVVVAGETDYETHNYIQDFNTGKKK